MISKSELRCQNLPFDTSIMFELRTLVGEPWCLEPYENHITPPKRMHQCVDVWNQLWDCRPKCRVKFHARQIDAFDGLCGLDIRLSAKHSLPQFANGSALPALDNDREIVQQMLDGSIEEVDSLLAVPIIGVEKRPII